MELSKRAFDLCSEWLQAVYVANLPADRASLQPPADTRAAESDQETDPALRPLIAEASNRFGVPARWIRAVMRTESGGDAGALSPKGAMGLMQVMPDTYAALRERYGLGGDPYAPRDNILAGAAYIREMYDRYGSPGFVAAYNAGPSRYDDYLAYGRELPDETRRYIAAVGAALEEDFRGSVLGSLLTEPQAAFHEPIAISPTGELLLGRTGQPLSVAERLAVHRLLVKATRR